MTPGVVYSYFAFGLKLASNVPVPGLIESTPPRSFEVFLHLGRLPEAFDASNYPDIWYESSDRTREGKPSLTIFCNSLRSSGYLLSYEDGTTVVFSGDLTAIWADWTQQSCLEEAATYILGPAMAIFTQLRGSTCLHGSAIMVGGSVIALLGPQGAGKSTSAAAFARAGYSVASDDLIILDYCGGQFLVQPSYPMVRLWPKTVQMMFGHEDAVPCLSPMWDKRGLLLDNSQYSFQATALPLAAIYILCPREDSEDAPFLTDVSGAAAIMHLVANSWAHYVNRPEFLARQFEVLTRLSRLVPVREVTAHQSFDRIGDLCRLLASQCFDSAGRASISG